MLNNKLIELWSRQMNDITSNVEVIDNVIYIYDDLGKLTKISLSTGEIKY